MADNGKFVRLIENLYTAVFERRQPKFNAPVRSAILNQETMPSATDDGVGTDISGGLRWYAPLAIIGANADPTPSQFQPDPTFGRVQYGAGVLDETQMTLVFRVAIPWASGSPPVANPCIFRWYDDATHFIQADWNSGTWRLRRAGGTVNTVTVADSFSAGDKRTLAFKLTATQIGISVDGAAFTMGASTSIPTLAATEFDILTSG